MAFLDVAGLHDQAAPVPQPLLAQVLVDRPECQQRRDREDAPLARLLVRDAQDVVALVNGLLGRALEGDERSPQGFSPARERKRAVEKPESEHFVLADLLDDRVGHDGGGQFHLLHGQFVLAGGGRKPAARRSGSSGLTPTARQGCPPQVCRQRHRPALAVRVDRRVRDLGERLLQVLEERRVVSGEDGQHPVVPHRGERFLLELRHLLDEHGPVEIPACGLQQVIERPTAVRECRADDIVGLAGVVEPLGDDDLAAVQLVNIAEFGLRLGHHASHDLIAVEPLAGRGVEGDHLAGLELPAGDDRCVVEPEHPGLAADVQPASLVGTPPDRS